jgi:hypothetical protein
VYSDYIKYTDREKSMNAVSGVNNNQNYYDLVEQATRRNTLTHVVDAALSETPIDRENLFEEVQLSNQELRDNVRELGIELYALNLQREAFETYANVSLNSNDTAVVSVYV